jgi:hypothetical protein
MRVRLHTNEWADFGAVRYQVEWETINTQNSDNDFNYDEDLTAHSRSFTESDYNLARAFARQLLTDGDPFCGLVSITKQTVTWFVEEDQVAQWQDTGDPEYIDSPTANKSSGG